MSGVEVAVNVLVGYCLAALLTWLVLPVFGYKVTIPDSLGISLVFTAASVLRSYVLRRFFNRVSEWQRQDQQNENG